MSGAASSLRQFVHSFGREVSLASARERLLFALVTVGNCWLVGSHLFTTLFPPNDTKHWLLRARYYVGLQMPASELPGQFATHPVSILLLALVVLVVGAPLLAAKLWTLGVYLGATASVYLAARELFSRRIALVAYAAVSFGQYLYLDVISWGGIPNLVAIAFTTLAVAALVRARRTEAYRDRFVLGLTVGLALFAHPPSAPVVAAIVGCAGVGLALATGDRGLVGRLALDVAVPVGLFAGYLASLWSIFVTYTASVDGHTLAVIWQMLLRNPPMALVFAVALAGLPILFVWLPEEMASTVGTDDVAAARLGSTAAGAIAFGWLLGPLVVAAVVTFLPGVRTELARVTYYLAAPMALLLAVYVDALARAFAARTDGTVWQLRLPGLTPTGAAVFVLVLVLVTPAFAASAAFYEGAQSYYTVEDDRSVYAVVQWVDEQQPFEGRVAGPFSVVPWVKALTGQDGLTPTPPSGSYRPDEAAEREAFLTLERVRTEGATSENLAAAQTVIDDYDVRYLVAPNNWRASRYGALGTRVYETEAFVVVDFEAPPERPVDSEPEPASGTTPGPTAEQPPDSSAGTAAGDGWPAPCLTPSGLPAVSSDSPPATSDGYSGPTPGGRPAELRHDVTRYPTSITCVLL